MTEAYYESFQDGYERVFAPRKTIASVKSKYQQIDIVELGGTKAMFIDDVLQLWGYDEFIYHEMLSHMSLIYHPEPKKVLVLGGGEGFLARELLKYQSVTNVTIVDIDQEVVNVAKKHLAEEIENSLDDPRVTMVVDDARKFARETKEKFDVVLMDLIDPYRHGADLYAAEQIGVYAQLLEKEGIFALHCEAANGPHHVGLKIYAKIKKLFAHSKLAWAPIFSLDGMWTFPILSNRELKPVNQQSHSLKTKFFDARNEPYYTRLPPYLQAKLEKYEKDGFDKLTEQEIVFGKKKC